MSVANKKKVDCSGCNACAEICPKDCIGMVKDAKGFFYPKVETDICIHCELCVKVCPLGKGNVKLHTPLKAFAAWNRDRNQHLASTSGGAAHVLSSYIIKMGGVVYGCTSEDIHIRHIRVDDLSELPKLQGSKYVQSDVCGLYNQIKKDLKDGRTVLFIGTPCQVAGLKNFIKNIPDRLYLVDLICHGVPSQQMLYEHIARVAKGREVRQIFFRKGNDIVVSLAGDNFKYEANVWKEPYKDMYIKGFFDCMTFRPSCYHCCFAQSGRVSDITIGDFWGLQGIENFPPETKDGISVLLPVSSKGLELITAVESALHITERSVDEAVRGNKQLQHPSIQGRRSRLFGLLYPVLPFDIAMNIVVADHKAIRKIKDLVYSLRHVCR